MKSELAYALVGAVLAALGQVSFKCGADARFGWLQFVNAWIFIGFALYLAGTVLWILALSKLPLTVVYPFAALTFVLVNIFAVVLLGERLSVRAVAGTSLVLLGLFLVTTSKAAPTPSGSAETVLSGLEVNHHVR